MAVAIRNRRSGVWILEKDGEGDREGARSRIACGAYCFEFCVHFNRITVAQFCPADNENAWNGENRGVNGGLASARNFELKRLCRNPKFQPQRSRKKSQSRLPLMNINSLWSGSVPEIAIPNCLPNNTGNLPYLTYKVYLASKRGAKARGTSAASGWRFAP
jgi:hypothetical protein